MYYHGEITDSKEYATQIDNIVLVIHLQVCVLQNI